MNTPSLLLLGSDTDYLWLPIQAINRTSCSLDCTIQVFELDITGLERRISAWDRQSSDGTWHHPNWTIWRQWLQQMVGHLNLCQYWSGVVWVVHWSILMPHRIGLQLRMNGMTSNHSQGFPAPQLPGCIRGRNALNVLIWFGIFPQFPSIKMIKGPNNSWFEAQKFYPWRFVGLCIASSFEGFLDYNL